MSSVASSAAYPAGAAGQCSHSTAPVVLATARSVGDEPAAHGAPPGSRPVPVAPVVSVVAGSLAGAVVVGSAALDSLAVVAAAVVGAEASVGAGAPTSEPAVDASSSPSSSPHEA